MASVMFSYYGESDSVIVAPDTVPLGVSIEILVRSYGGGCTGIGRTDIEDIDGGLLITPIDITVIPGEGFACPAILIRREHRINRSFHEPGPVRIVVRGRKLVLQDPESGGEIILLEKVVEVSL